MLAIGVIRAAQEFTISAAPPHQKTALASWTQYRLAENFDIVIRLIAIWVMRTANKILTRLAVFTDYQSASFAPRAINQIRFAVPPLNQIIRILLNLLGK